MTARVDDGTGRGVASGLALEGVHVARRRRIRVRAAGDRIAHVEDLGPAPAPASDDVWIAPGLVDIQINGCGGYDFNGPRVDVEEVADATRLLWRHGVTSFLPTVVTNPIERISHSLRVLATAAGQDGLVAASIAGVHLEGPFISPQDGARGSHDVDHVIPPDWDQFQRWQDVAGGRIRIVTLSPEWPGAVDFIRRCTASGVVVAIGHTAATPDDIRRAVAAGARLSTHLGNGAHTMLPRHPNYLWEQLAQDDLWASLIADGDHLPDSVIKVILRAKGERAVLVSDSVSAGSLPEGEYRTPTGRHVRVMRDGRVVLAANPELLAGSGRLLLHDVAHVAGAGLASLAAAWEMASTRPAGLLQLPVAKGLRPGAPADVVTFRRRRSEVELLTVHKRGQRVGGSAAAGSAADSEAESAT